MLCPKVGGGGGTKISEVHAIDKSSFVFLRCVLLPGHLPIMAVDLYKFTVSLIEMVYINGISHFLSLKINFIWELLLPLISTESGFYPNSYLLSINHSLNRFTKVRVNGLF